MRIMPLTARARSASTRSFRLALGLVITTGLLPGLVVAQDRLKAMPGYEHFQQKSKEIIGSVKLGTLSATWLDGGKAFEYPKDGKRYRYDIAEAKATEVPDGTPEPKAPEPTGRRGRQGGPARGRQFNSSVSPDGLLKATYRDRNLYLGDARGAVEMPITTDGNAQNRVKSGTGSWVYGEELDQVTAMWWSPDSKTLAFYRFDESPVNDYYLEVDQTKVQSRMDVEAYPKAGTPNPIVDVLLYDVESRKTTKADVRDGKPFEDSTVGYYVYGLAWSPDGKELLLHRTNRRQNVLELAACDPATGKCRTIVHEEWPASWVENSPQMRFLADGRRFLWTTERNGWKNWDLCDLDGKRLAEVTKHDGFEAGAILRLDEEAGVVDYMAHDGDNPMKLQLHRAKLDGSGDRRLTDPAYLHTVNVAPDGKHILDTIQTHDTPPSTRLIDDEGHVLAELARSDTSKFDELGLKHAELITFKAADGQTDLHGILNFPCHFDPSQKYPLLVSVYAGPATNGAREAFVVPNPMTEYGFLVASFDSRSAAGRGKKILDSIYGKLGTVEIDDQAAGVKALWDRPYLDRNRVGIFGTSYGGYASLLALLKHPDVFRAASSSSPVTAWEHYDTIYTERYMMTPQENPEGYKAGSAVEQADKLHGRLMLYYGSADDNVHPNNAMQMIAALQRAGKSFELQVGPDQGHSALRMDRMMEFFIENLVLDSPANPRREQPAAAGGQP
jgi:dipeptidyl-peptidase-4